MGHAQGDRAFRARDLEVGTRRLTVEPLEGHPEHGSCPSHVVEDRFESVAILWPELIEDEGVGDEHRIAIRQSLDDRPECLESVAGEQVHRMLAREVER